MIKVKFGIKRMNSVKYQMIKLKISPVADLGLENIFNINRE